MFICDKCVGMCVDIIEEEHRGMKRFPQTDLIGRTDGHVVLGDWAATCLDALGCRVVWPVVTESRRIATRVEVALAELLPELQEPDAATRLIVVQVDDFARALGQMADSGCFEMKEVIRESKHGRLALFRTSLDHIAALLFLPKSGTLAP